MSHIFASNGPVNYKQVVVSSFANSEQSEGNTSKDLFANWEHTMQIRIRLVSHRDIVIDTEYRQVSFEIVQ